MRIGLRYYMWLGVAVFALLCTNNVAPVFADDENQQDMTARIDRVERRMNQMADQQQRLLNRMGTMGQHRGLMPPPPNGPGPDGPRAPSPSTQVHWPGPHAKAAFWKAMCWVKLAMFVCIVCHVLLAVWVYTDIRKRGEGHGIFIILALLAGFLGAGLYALIRIGEKKG